MKYRRNAAEQEQVNKTPAWIVSFTDMITLLLAFFVLLQSFAHKQDPDLFFTGQGSFRRAIAGLGIPDLLFGKESKPARDYRKTRHPTEQTDKERAKSRIIDADADRIRKIFAYLKMSMETRVSDAGKKTSNLFPTPITFRKNSADLNQRAREYLWTLADNMKENVNPKYAELYVIGLAEDASSDKQRWLLSARRARVVEKFLTTALSGGDTHASWTLHAWGGGSKNQWQQAMGLTTRRSFIVIAIMTEEDRHGG